MLVFIAINQVDDPLVGATVGQELLYWCVRISVLVVGLWGADMLVSRYLADRWKTPDWLKPVILVSAIGLLPFALAEILVEPHLPMRPEYVDDDLWAFSPLLAYLGEYITIVSILLPAHLILWLILDWRAKHPGESSTPGAVPKPEFLKLAYVQAVSDVLALEAEEHYVRIHTRDGAELVHYRFGDAAAEMPDELGLQVHRSWWVAENAVASASRGSRRWQLVLVSDIAVPVSDSYVSSVREKGWLKKKGRR